MPLFVVLALISHDRAKKGNAMLMIIFSFIGFLLVCGVTAALASLRQLPRSNEDWIYY